MTFRIRPTRVPEDAGQVAAVLRVFEPEGFTAEELARVWANVPDGGLRYRLVAETGDGRVIASAGAAHDTWDVPERWFGGVTVLPEFQRQGVGSALLADLVHFVRDQGGRRFSGGIRDNDAESLRWLQARGGKIDRHTFESTLDLDSFDESRFAGAVEAVAAGGIRFFTLADDPSEQTLRGLYNFVSQTLFDVPGFEAAEFPAFEEWRKGEDPEVNPRDCQWLAADGDRIVGTTVLVPKASGAMYTRHTSVDRGYRGRGIALALKLLSVQTARRYGAHRMRTNNDEVNAPMLAINRKLGYQPEPGIYSVDLFL